MPATTLGMLGQLHHNAQELVLEGLKPGDQSSPNEDLASLRLASRAAQGFVDGAVQQLTTRCTGGRQTIDRVRCIDWSTALSQVEGVLSLLPTRWPRCTSLKVHTSPPAPGHPDDDVVLVSGEEDENRDTDVDLLRRAGPPLQEQLAAAFSKHAAAAARLTHLGLQLDMHGLGVDLHPGLLPALASACPNLTALSLEGDCWLPVEGAEQQEAAFRSLASLPRLSSLTLPGPAGLQHVGLLAGQLTELTVGKNGAYVDAGQDGNSLRQALGALASLTRLTSLTTTPDPWNTCSDPQAGQSLLSSLPPSLQQLHLYIFHCTAALSCRGDALDVALREPVDVWALGELAGPLMALQQPGGRCSRRLGLLHAVQLRLTNALGTDEARAVRRVLAACEAVRVERFTGSHDVEPECWAQVAVLMQGLWGPEQPHQLDVELEVSLPSCKGVVVPVRVVDAPADEQPDDQRAPPPCLTSADLLRPLVCAAGEGSRFLLLLSGGLADREADEVQAWLRDHVAQHAQYDKAELAADLCGVALEYGSAADAALAARGLRAQRPTCEGCEVLVLPTRELVSAPRVEAAAAEALRSYVEEHRATCGMAAVWEAAQGRWSNFCWLEAVGRRAHKGQAVVASVPWLKAWRRLAKAAAGEEEEHEDEEDGEEAFGLLGEEEDDGEEVFGNLDGEGEGEEDGEEDGEDM